MMLLPVLRPVSKSAGRLLLAGGRELEQLGTPDHGVSLEAPATAVYQPQPQLYAPMHGELSSRQMHALAQPSWGGRWPVAVENVLAQRSGNSHSSNQEQVQAQALQEQQPVSSQDGQSSETGVQCMWQLDARAVFPPGACVWPAIFMTGDGCFTGFPVGSVAASQDVTQQAQQTGAAQPSGDAANVAQPAQVNEATSNGSTSPRNGISRTIRTSASRKQRRRLKAANAANVESATSPAADEQLERTPALPGLVSGPRGGEVPTLPAKGPEPLPSEETVEATPRSPSEGPGQLWPPTPESTPPCSPREFGSFCAFPGIWHVEIPSMVLPEPVALPEMSSVLTEEVLVPDAESQACEKMIAQLDEDSSRAEVMDLLWSSTWSMACTPGGTRVVQKALEVADTTERISLAEQLQGHVKEAFASPHANHVLQKCIELIPPDRLHFVLSEMLGHAVAAARHRYGCRVLERLLEHCPTEQTAPLVEEVLAGAPQLCRHTFGNFVVQHVLEHGTASQKRQVVDVIHADIQRLARHRVASHVVRCALKHGAPEDRQKLVQAIRKDPADLADLAHHHCGSFVVREMRRADGLHR
ncbi:APUM1 [Symbiodinium necroappetens]|uniref:APUM1 protein n=1 Tax=Symbiodinium necroappetens TaxID=1628268 RepID=A0A813CJT0_9DINO|nr:APUM1 [Symbiodinium microadriaticum]CAE7884911.1 APUM1 [Symbiodinium sp. KB8]CAE7943184.1 APUM1 [Symbiodinium necroappetens]